MPYIERRGNSIRVKWWGGKYKLDAEGRPTKTKIWESASGPEPGVPFQDEDEAYNFGLDREYDVRHGRHVPRADAQTLMEKYVWLWFKAASLRPNSASTYKSMLNAVIVPYWGARPVGAITALEYDLWKVQIEATYSDNYADQLRGLFRMLMNDAILKYKLRTDSPVIEQRRRGKYTKKKTRREKSDLPIQSVHQTARNAHTVWGYTGWVYIWTIALTGMRPPGEMFGLQRGYSSAHWPASDPDPARRRAAVKRYKNLHALRVQHQLYRLERTPVLAGPKYESFRTLVIPPFLHEMHCALLASHDQPFVFLSKTGLDLSGAQFERDYWHPIRDGWDERKPKKGYERFARDPLPAVADMKGEDIYRLRHWHRELLDQPGADIARVAAEARMGHELPGVEGVYSNVTLEMETRIVSYLQEVWDKFLDTGPWLPPFPKPLPDDQGERASSLFSGYRILEDD
ncbi:integrase [Streptomyces sp. STCH 565 A]|uniref:integrase n=1 Tax=Streptomyces sp. STCH 565 A TaxID=2950532 RepID=UPI0020755593|nr:integrase [Streptomyces sp. STCH 565 A]MCM8548963.1 integrase [Streptomyces sp. STCH 565 A]